MCRRLFCLQPLLPFYVGGLLKRPPPSADYLVLGLATSTWVGSGVSSGSFLKVVAQSAMHATLSWRGVENVSR